MERTGKRTARDPAEARFGLDEWLGALLALAGVLAGAAAVLAVAYWLVMHR